MSEIDLKAKEQFKAELEVERANIEEDDNLDSWDDYEDYIDYDEYIDEDED